jgi:hypothetical protein
MVFMEIKRVEKEKTVRKTFTMYPSVFGKLKELSSEAKVSNSEMLEMIINYVHFKEDK